MTPIDTHNIINGNIIGIFIIEVIQVTSFIKKKSMRLKARIRRLAVMFRKHAQWGEVKKMEAVAKQVLR